MPETTKVEGATATFTPSTFAPGDQLFILDDSTMNIASKPMNLISGSWKLTPQDFNKVGMVRVRVEHNGLPVEAAGVTLKAGKETQNELIDKSSLGEATFYAVPAGQVTVEVQYKRKDGSSADPIEQSSRLALRRQKEAAIIVSIDDDVATVVGEQSPEVKKALAESESEEKGGMGVLGRLITFLLALAVAALAVFFGLKYLKANQDKVQAKLSSMGVEIPSQEGPADDASASPPAPIAPPPPAQILLEDSAPTPLGTAPAAVSVGAADSASISDPRLTAADGSSIPLAEGTTTVGREAGLELSLLDESTVSRRHAEIVRAGSSVVLRDLGSTNGSFVNGVQVQGETALRPGDQVQLGAIRFRFEG